MPMRSLSPWGGRRRLPSSDLFSQFEDFINEFDRGESNALTRAGFDFSPSVDVEEKDNAYLVSADLPGMKKEDIKVELNDNILTISGERTRETKSEGHYSERSYGRFQRSFTLPVKVLTEKIEAHFEDGVLHLTLPKSEGARSHSIKIM
ncbi:Hsp20/alpha crystallin family protein [Bdellovibrio bacteriovorus]|uniref:Hsp20/alpha crystallin family protein n=1 Tax=Bdellovibrio bacteriovorus TaxID=959 RepID=UPI0035A6352E